MGVETSIDLEVVWEVLRMWGIVVIAVACCMAFGAVDVSARLHKEKRKKQSPGLDKSASEELALRIENFDIQNSEGSTIESR